MGTTTENEMLKILIRYHFIASSTYLYILNSFEKHLTELLRIASNIIHVWLLRELVN